MSSQKQLTPHSQARGLISLWFLRALVPDEALLERIKDGKGKGGWAHPPLIHHGTPPEISATKPINCHCS